MEIEFFGANCVRIKTKKTTIVIDDTLAAAGSKSILNDKTVAFYSQPRLLDPKASTSARLVIDSPGEFEVGDVTVKGLQARAHIDNDDELSATVYQFMWSGQTVTVLGHVHPDITTEVAELAGGTDVLILPVGGNGFTLDPVGAAAVIKKLEPDVVIPSQYEIKGLSYEVPAQPLDEFMKVSSMSSDEPATSFKIGKASDDGGTAQTKLVVLLPQNK